jgi:glycosyltransferase involved in cell wall biosynthesis
MVNERLKVHIVGTHGVPAKYGGFETLADYLCQNLHNDFDITVYCNAFKYTERPNEYFGVKLKYIRIEANGFKGIFYDLYTYVYALLTSDVILYLSPVGSGFMTPLKYLTGKKVIVNHGGLNEWEREKLNWLQKKWAKFNHRIAAKFANSNIVDNELYQTSLKQTFNAESIVIRYGGDHAKKISKEHEPFSMKYPFVNEKYAVSVSRAQVDNNIHIVLEAFEHFYEYKIVLVSNWNISNYGKELKDKYKGHPNMILLDAIYDKEELDFVRGNAYLYIHSHSRCGTAPSLVEAMNLELPVLSFDVPTNRETTKNEALYFYDALSLQNILSSISEEQICNLRLNLHSIALKEYSWKTICHQYKKTINEINLQ